MLKKFALISLVSAFMFTNTAFAQTCKSGYIPYNNTCVKKLACKNGGTQSGNKCVCKSGWTGNLCQTAKKCPYKDTKCSSGYYATGKTCQTGNKKVVECKANACTGYSYTKCPTGYAQSASCLSGKTKKLKCESCASGYIKYQGKCIKKLACKNGGTQSGNKCVCKSGWTGNLCQTAAKCPYSDTKCATGYVATGKTCQTGNKKVVECKANACTGYSYTKCPTGYVQSATCQSGKTKKLKCETCASGYIKYQGKCIKKLDCKNGAQSGNKCVCKNGWTGNLCQTARTCPYNTTRCDTGYIATGNTCQTGNTKVIECKANPCSGYNYTTCPAGYTKSATCQSGKNTKLKCDNCASGYVKFDNKCYKSISCKNGGRQSGNQCICPNGWSGTYCETANACGYNTTQCGAGYLETGNTCRSGATLYKECRVNPCDGYVLTCPDGYHATRDICLSGNTNMYKCEINTCEGFDYTECPTGYNVSALCQAGDTLKYKCDVCASDYHKEDGICIRDINCNHGRQQGEKCLCEHGWGGDFCNTCAQGYHDDNGDCILTMECNHGQQQGTSCSCNNGWHGDYCNEADVCDGYNYIQCPTGYNVSAVCQTGDTLKYKCDVCAPNYHKYNGVCVPDLECNHGYQEGETCRCNTGWHGDYCDEADTCEGFDYTECPQGYNISARCQAGDTLKLQCSNCAQGYHEENGICIETLNCNNGNQQGNTCVCHQGWSGDYCNSCANGYTDYNGDCIEIIECNNGQQVGNACRCAEGWSGEFCNTCAQGYHNDNGECVLTLECNHGRQQGNSCQCYEGWDGDYCTECAQGYHNFEGNCVETLECNNGQQKGHTCLCNEGWHGDYCDQADTCEGFEYQQCPSGYIVKASCLAGNTIKYKCRKDSQESPEKSINNENITKNETTEDDLVGYEATENTIALNAYAEQEDKQVLIELRQSGNGDVYGMRELADEQNAPLVDENDALMMINAAADNSARAEGKINIIDNSHSKSGNIYGMYSDAKYMHIINTSLAENPTEDASSFAVININNTSDKNVYGISSAYTASNVDGADIGSQEGRIIINNTGNGNVYGISAAGNVYNTEAKMQDNLTAKINITNNGNGDVYGILSQGNKVYNAFAGHERGDEQEKDDATATAEITIQNVGNGDVYGIKNLNQNHNGVIYNAIAYYGSYAEGTVRVTNNGTGNAYGLWGDNIYNAFASNVYGYFPTASGSIKINNEGNGNAYGIYGCNVYNGSGSIIEMVNVGSGLAIGIYAADGVVENSGQIIIHNHGDGTAVGIYADGNATVTNSGEITIDRAYYTDFMSDGYNSYYAASVIGGKAIGIYGTSGSNIINTETGIISINDAQTAYGIWSESGNITNNGIIRINGQFTENAIRLNAGTLFQNGTMYVGADWNNTGEPGESGAIYGTTNGINNNIINLENNSSNLVIGMLAETQSYGIANALNASAEINIENSGNGNIYGILTTTNIGTNARTGRGDAAYTATSGKINITNEGDGNIYGLSTDLSAENAATNQYQLYGETAEALSDKTTTGEIKIINQGNGSVYGLYGYNPENAKNDWSLDSQSLLSGTIEIENEGTGNVYGAYGTKGSGAYNVHAYNSVQTKYLKDGTSVDYISTIETTGNITLSNIGSGDVYGLYGQSDSYNLYNGGYKSTTEAVLQISNEGNGKVYGIYSYQGNITNAYINLNIGNDERGFEVNNSTAEIILNNDGDGEVYGLLAEGNYPLAYNLRSDIWYDDVNYRADASIAITNTGDADVYGIKAYYVYNLSASNFDRPNVDTILNSIVDIKNEGNGNVYGLYGSDVTNSNTSYQSSSAKILLDNTGTGNVYGMYGNTVTNSHSNSGEIIITAQNSANVYGMYSHGGAGNGVGKIILNTVNAQNVYGMYSHGGATTSGIIAITNDGDAYVYGMYTDSTNNYVTSTGSINIDNTGNGNIYGMYALHNSMQTSNYDTDDGTINITNTGTGIAYGIYAGEYSSNYGLINIDNAGYGSAYGIYAAGTSYNGGLIKINNLGNGNAYGMYGNPNNSGTINIINHAAGNVYGLGIGTLYSGVGNDDMIEIVNRGDGLAVGIYADNADFSFNSTLKIHNLGNGVAVGVYADGDTEFENKGIIIIDRNSYTDNNGTVYAPDSARGGKAIGIYGARNTDIENSGIIRIYGAETAYGIFSEGGNVENSGTIEIDGQYTENAIRINGGTLFQNGTMYVGADWGDTGQQGNGNDEDDDENTIIINENIYRHENSDDDVIGRDINEGRATVANVYADEQDLSYTIEVTQEGSGSAYGIRQLDDGENSIPDENDDFEMYNAVAGYGKTATGTIRVINTGDGNGRVAGIYSNAEYITYIGNSSVDTDDHNSSLVDTANGIIDITNTGNKKVYGILSAGDAGNAEGDMESTGNATITISNTGNGNVYGIKAARDVFSADASENGTANSLIQINNTGDGKVFGMFNSYAYAVNAEAGYQRGIGEAKDASVAKSLININNDGDSNVFGIMSYNGRYSNGNMFNAYAYYNSTAEGRVRILNNGTGNAYGLWSAQDIYNAFIGGKDDTYSPIARGIVTVINEGNGNAVGIAGQHVHNESDGTNQFSTIEIVNRGNGLAVGIYTENGWVVNSGEIKIHNLGGGTAIGIYSDGQGGIQNYGTITIDRANYTDDMGTEDESDDVTYSAQVSQTDRAIGIYGATGNIINQIGGVINISGASEAYGIYTEGGQITNNGTIIIDGNYNHENAIVLNGGSLIQNGLLLVEDNYDKDNDDDDFEFECNNDTITKDETSSEAVVGMDKQDITVLNAYAHEKDETGLIEVTQRGTGSVYGMRATVTDPQMGDDDDEDDFDNFDLINSATDSAYVSTGIIRVNNLSDGDGEVFGMCSYTRDIYTVNATYDEDEASEDTYAEGLIEINSTTGNKNIYGISSGMEATNAEGDDLGLSSGIININNQGNGDVYGIKAYDAAYNTDATDNSAAEGVININNTGNGKVYGLYSIRSYMFNAMAGHARDSWKQKDSATARALININNTGNGDVYGMKGVFEDDENKKVINAQAYYNSTASGRIRISNNGSGTAFGMYGTSVYNAFADGDLGDLPQATGTINIINSGDGTAVGMYGHQVYNIGGNDIETSTIEMVNIGNQTAIGIYAENGEVINYGDIKIHNLGDGTAIGIYADGTSVDNDGNITIDRSSYVDNMGTVGEDEDGDDVTYSAQNQVSGLAIGIYGTANSLINNSGRGVITINGASEAYGIYSEGGRVNNSGTIIIDGNSNHENAIVLNGGKLFQDGILVVSNNNNLTSSDAPVKPKKQAASLNLNDFGGTVVASETSQFIVEGNISGDLAINNSVVENGFNTVYTVNGMIKAADTNGLKLISQSALFDATLKNNSDAVMTMKSFNDVIKNKSLADFLKRNYSEAHNEQLFNLLKNKETLASLNSTVNSLAAVDVFNRFNFEDLTMMRELNMDVNNTLFNNDEDYLVTSGNVAPFYFDNDSGSSGRYALYNHRIGKTSYGLSMAFTNINSRDRNDDNHRHDETFQMAVPFGYNTHGFKFITAPRFGYAYGNYTRNGYEGRTYDGNIEKRMFGITNEVRYPLSFGKWNVSPSAEFNMLGYHLKGHEDAKDYALRIKSQNNYSVEAGLGLYANRELKPTKNSNLKLTAGIAAYHEFMDPYAVELGMQNMSGSFNIRDERRKDNRAVIRTGFDYSYGNLTVEGSWATYIDGTTHNNANLDFRYNF